MAPGVEVNTKVGVLCLNVSAFAAAPHGILRIGTKATTVNSVDTADEIEKQLQDVGWLITVSSLLAGDTVTVTPGSVFRIVDRIKGLIKYKSHPVAPAIVEGLL